jgi:multisubunit Na+/H+ antiporter MnhG subunit
VVPALTPRPPASREAGGGLRRPLGLYALGHALLLFGAWAMDVTGSMLPLALAASACLLLTLPVVRQLRARAAARRGRLDSRRL